MTEESVKRHGVAWRLRGFPIYDHDEDDESYIRGYMDEPQWHESDLTPAQVAEVDALVAEHLAKRPADDPMQVRWAVLDLNGIEHEHRKGKPLLDYRPAYGYECAMCHAAVIVKEPGDSQFVGGPWHGRWAVIPDGLNVVRVPMVGGDVVDYWRGRDGRYYVGT